MGRIYTGLVAWNLAVLAAAGVLGVLVRADLLEPRVHRLGGLFATVFACLIHSLLVVHFVGSMKWIQQTGPTAGLDDTKRLRRRWFQGGMFPVVLFTMLVAVATGMSGGRVAAGTGYLTLHVLLALANVPMNLWALKLGRAKLASTKRRIRRVQQLAELRIGKGLVEDEPDAALVPESGRAGGKVFLFLSVNVWLLYLYVRFVLRHPDEPVWPYAAACAVLAVVGWRLLRHAAEDDDDDDDEPQA